MKDGINKEAIALGEEEFGDSFFDELIIYEPYSEDKVSEKNLHLKV